MDERSEVVSVPELREALADYVERANANAEVARALGTWSCLIHIEATDSPGAQFTLRVERGRSGAVIDGLSGDPDLVVSGRSMDLAEIFWGDVNPAGTYMQGNIHTRGSAKHVFRLDAMAMYVFAGHS